MTLKHKFRIIFTAFLSIIALVAIGSTTLLMSNTAQAKDHEDYEEHQMMLLALKSSPISLNSILATFKTDYPSIVTEIELDEEDNILLYEIKGIDLEEGTRYKAHYALHNGEKISSHSKSLRFMGFNKLDDHDLAALETVKNQGISIEDAIALTKLPEGSYIESIELERKRGLTFYEVKSIGPAGSTKALIDAKSGETVPSLRR